MEIDLLRFFDSVRANLAPITRSALRYVSGVIGGTSPLWSDPDTAIALAVALGFITEVVYAVAKRKGWTT